MLIGHTPNLDTDTTMNDGKNQGTGDFSGGPVVKTLPSSAGGAVRSLVGKLRSHMPHGQKTKTQNRSNIVTNSIKTFKKWSTSKKKKKIKEWSARGKR